MAVFDPENLADIIIVRLDGFGAMNDVSQMADTRRHPELLLFFIIKNEKIRVTLRYARTLQGYFT